MMRWFLVLIVLWFGVFVYFAFPVAKQAYHNAFLTQSIPPKSAHWSIQDVHDEKWIPQVKYTYEVDGRLFENDEIFQGYSYRNPYAAKESLQEIISEHPVVWYSPKNPENSTMEKFFPKKRAVYSGLILLLFVYFAYGLNLILQKINRGKT